jgi:signal peptidase I
VRPRRFRLLTSWPVTLAPPLLGIAIALVIVRGCMAVVVVEGLSMIPACAPGDRALVRRRGGRRLLVGDVIVFREPGLDGSWTPAPGVRDGQWVIKRVAAVSGDAVPGLVRPAVAVPIVPGGALVVLGDNMRASRDSRSWGLIPDEVVLGRVVRLIPGGQSAPPPD